MPIHVRLIPGWVLWLGALLGATVSVSASDFVTEVAEVSVGTGGFAGPLTPPLGPFGLSISNLGDVDGDGVDDLVVSGSWREVWILFMDATGWVRAQAEVRFTDPGGTSADLGAGVAGIGDVNGDGVPDLAVGDPGSDDGVWGAGAIWILFLNVDGSIATAVKISNTRGGLGQVLAAYAGFGTDITLLGAGADGRTRIAVGAPGIQPNSSAPGAVWILTLNQDGTVGEAVEVGSASLPGLLDEDDRFGSAVASIGDMDGDGVTDIAVGAEGDDDRRVDGGALWILLMHADGTVRNHRKISGLSGDLPPLEPRRQANFGRSVVSLPALQTGDLTVLAVGMPGYRSDPTGGPGAAWLFAFDPAGNLVTSEKITGGSKGFHRVLPDEAEFGASLGARSVDGSGRVELLVGAPGMRDGVIWRLGLDGGAGDCDGNGLPDGFDRDCNDNGVPDACDLDPNDPDGDGRHAVDCNGNGIPDECDLARDGDCNANGTPDACDAPDTNGDGVPDDCFGAGAVRVTEGTSGFSGTLDPNDWFGPVAGLGHRSGDSAWDLVVGAPRDDDGGRNLGALWLLNLNADGSVAGHRKISATEGGLMPLDAQDLLGTSVTGLGDLDGDGVGDLAVGERWRATVLLLNADGSVKDQASHDYRSLGLSAIGDLDGDGRTELATSGYTHYPPDSNSVTILFLEPDGTERAHHRIEGDQSNFGGRGFGATVSGIGDLNADGIPDIAVSRARQNAIWILFLNSDGSVQSYQQITSGVGGFVGLLEDYSGFGTGISPVGDLDGDGVTDLVAGESRRRVAGRRTGTAWLLFLRSDGTVRGHRRISPSGFAGTLSTRDFFGSAVASLGDLDGDGVADLAIGALGDDTADPNAGAVWVVPVNCGSADCDGDGVGDRCEPDCNENGVPDDCDIAAGTSVDLDGNGTPDVCDGIGNSTSDCNGNGDPDGIEVFFGVVPDCNGNGVPDSCDLAAGVISDCNGNGIPDECDIVSGRTADVLPPEGDGIPDDCQSDCNGNLLPDAGERTPLTDCDGDAVLDTCELAAGFGSDCNGDGVLDQCQDIAGLGGFALAFSEESEDVVQVPGSLLLRFERADDMTLEARIRPADVNGARTIVAKGRATEQDYAFGILDGHLRFGFGNVDLGSGPEHWYTSESAVLVPGVWHHVAVRHRFGTNDTWLSLDGHPVTGAWPARKDFAVSSSAPIRIGALRRSGEPGHTDAFVGEIDEVRLFRTLRSDAEIAADAHRTIEPNTPGLTAYWRFDEGARTESQDLTGGGYDGSVVGASWLPTSPCGCAGDTNGDGRVDSADLSAVLAQFGRAGTALAGDVDGDGDVDLSDLAAVLRDFGSNCG